ncbi:putative sulfate transporter [Suhomyces tanzawaensis NRRL Y-17324]|uniref:Putative sulfate transporter n=1 Tax=Suhomyces tanzawaensis NRRL Y-17324 TaxID=984487 RepID=A0A1E4SQH1_9ASCO|nr:putative sulfate transporter [Suhomyces tanzawaensis NRRL Y-17324]ODV81749.1 putative sulfate transporter [Suhomyces tanzawaensis NRRL Y-17324]
MTDENTRLLRTPKRDGPRPRPTLYTVPSSQSLRSLKTLNDPTINSYLDTIDDEPLGWNAINRVKNLASGRPKDGFDTYAYCAYYLPILNWLPNYNYRESLAGDFLAGLSLASFQIPLVMSFATSLAHLPPITGLYSIIIGSTVYSIFGCVPVLVVGASPSTAIMYGQTIEYIRHEKSFLHFTELEISSAISATLSGILLASGLLRFGFLDNVLSRALLKGFIGAMGFIMIINELSTEMGLEKLALEQPHLTVVDKILFAFRNFPKSHRLTLTISLVTLIIVVSIKTYKEILIHKYKIKKAVFIPEILLMVIVATFLSWYFEWNSKGVEIVGDITSSNHSFKIVNPFQWKKLALYERTFTIAFVSTLLGFFDSTTATKSLGTQYNFNVSSNRELIALGSTNFVVSLVSGLPAFGAFGRSKLNILSGATTPMAGIFVAICTFFSIIYLLPLLHFLPECVLALTTTVIGITVIQEVPSDLKFFYNIGGYDEIITFLIIFFATILWGTPAGISMGVLVAVIRVIKHSSRSRIHILGRVPNTSIFRNADELIEESFATFEQENEAQSFETLSPSNNVDKLSSLISEIEEIEGVLIIKIPEPLNFANVGDLKSKLNRIEKYGSLLIHPSQPNSRAFNNDTVKSIIFDCKGMTKIDSSATQVLYEIVKKYTESDCIRVCFSRLPVDGTIRDKFNMAGITSLVNNNFKASNSSSSTPDPTSSVGMGDGFFLSIEKALGSVDQVNV